MIINSVSKKHKVIHVGSSTNRHSPLKDKEIKEEIKKIKKNSQDVKIVVVVDSFWKVIKAIGDDYGDCFLMLDEIDTFQTDAEKAGVTSFEPGKCGS